MSLKDYLRALIRWLASLHAPLGRGSPFVATALFVVAALSHSHLLRAVAYIGACVILMLVAADIAKSFIDPASFPLRRSTPLTWPILTLRIVLTGILGGTYAVLVWLGMGPWLPLIVWPVMLAICCCIAWRNIDLWYEQGAEFEEELAEEAHRQTAKLSGPSQPQLH